jgi:hypothetical protein
MRLPADPSQKGGGSCGRVVVGLGRPVVGQRPPDRPAPLMRCACLDYGGSPGDQTYQGDRPAPPDDNTGASWPVARLVPPKLQYGQPGWRCGVGWSHRRDRREFSQWQGSARGHCRRLPLPDGDAVSVPGFGRGLTCLTRELHFDAAAQGEVHR